MAADAAGAAGTETAGAAGSGRGVLPLGGLAGAGGGEVCSFPAAIGAVGAAAAGGMRSPPCATSEAMTRTFSSDGPCTIE